MLPEQLKAGADLVQIFDSWAGGLDLRSFCLWVVEPTVQVVAKVREQMPNAKIIGFPRATTQLGYETYVSETKVDAISIDTATNMQWASTTLSRNTVLQGNLDPLALVAGGAALDKAIDQILRETEGTPFIFNLGHGVLPDTPVEHVQQLIERVRSLT